MTESIVKKVEENPEVIQKAARRRFTGDYKRRIAIEAEGCQQPGEIGALLRRAQTRGALLVGTRSLAPSTSGRIIVIIEKVKP